MVPGLISRRQALCYERKTLRILHHDPAVLEQAVGFTVRIDRNTIEIAGPGKLLET
jgi:hypothetical protein